MTHLSLDARACAPRSPGRASPTCATSRETASTNDDAAALLGDPAAAGATLVAEFQTRRPRAQGRAGLDRAGRQRAALHDDPAARRSRPRRSGRCRSGRARRRRRRRRPAAACGSTCAGRTTSTSAGAKRPASCASRASRGDDAHVGVRDRAQRAPPARRRARRDRAAARLSLATARRGVEREDVLAGDPRRDGRAASTCSTRPDDVARAWEERAGLRGRPYRLRLDADGRSIEGTAVRLDPDGGLVARDGGARAGRPPRRRARRLRASARVTSSTPPSTTFALPSTAIAIDFGGAVDAQREVRGRR